MKVKHSKYKNTGILFELLTRQLTADTIADNQPKALSIIQKYFSGNSNLLKEEDENGLLSEKNIKS